MVLTTPAVTIVIIVAPAAVDVVFLILQLLLMLLMLLLPLLLIFLFLHFYCKLRNSYFYFKFFLIKYQSIWFDILPPKHVVRSLIHQLRLKMRLHLRFERQKIYKYYILYCRTIRGQCYKNYFVRNLWIFVIS